MAFPSPPWHLSAQMWLSVFRVPAGAGVEPGVYGVAFVSYEPPGVLSYRELLVARLLDTRRRRVRITDIWVDDETSRAGGRVLWAIPKELADFDLEETRVGPTAHTALAARVDEVTVASAQFASAPGAALVRAPFAATLVQPRDGRDLLTPWRGSAKSLPALGSWEFDPSGPLAFLQGRRPLVSFRLTDVRLVFG
nr:acetoacetate decarboxylase family protein [uncultured Nocardioides sp.]